MEDDQDYPGLKQEGRREASENFEDQLHGPPGTSEAIAEDQLGESQASQN